MFIIDGEEKQEPDRRTAERKEGNQLSEEEYKEEEMLKLGKSEIVETGRYVH